MGERTKRVVPTGVEAGILEPGAPPALTNYEVVEEWREESPTQEWTDWSPWEMEQEKTGALVPLYDREKATLFRPAPLAKMVPEVKITMTRERRLVRRWVDRERGPMAEIVDREVDVQIKYA